MDTTEVLKSRELLADAFQLELADKDTFFRSENAELLGDFLSAHVPSPEAARAVIGFAATDKTDGFWATTAKIIRGYDKPTAGAAEDPAADHKTISQVFRGLIESAENNDQGKEARRLIQLKKRAEERDKRQDENRAVIANNPCIDQRELRANMANKSKMVIIILGQAALAKVPYEKKLKRRAALGIVGIGVRVGEYGERKFRKKVGELLIGAQKNQSTPHPFGRR